MAEKQGTKAAIYIRTSSEHQGEKASPDEQEADCRRLADEHGLTVVAVYRDTERYRVRSRLVDPSGTRADRPGLVAMLRDAAEGHFDTIIAWREDRLYRGMRAMLSVLEAIQEHKLNVLLARETFDPKMAPVKAWVAQMELDGMRERMTMGVKARLRAGKANTGQDRYGYRRNGEVIEIVEEEAHWVREIFDWYVKRVPQLEIRRRLIEADAPQKGSSVPRRIQWAISSIQAILGAAKEYTFGIKIQTRCGEVFEIPVPPILSKATYQRFLEVRQGNKTHPSHNLKRDYLIMGLVYCDCPRKWGAHSTSPRKRNRKGILVERKTRLGVYFCPERHAEHIHPDCPRTIGAKKADEYVWSKACEVLSNPDVLLLAAREHVDQLRQRATEIQAENERLQEELDSLAMERQWVITRARKGLITDDDMEYQLSALSLQELHLKREMMTMSETARLSALDNWEDTAREYLATLYEGLEELNAEPETKEDCHELFQMRRQIVLALVEKVLIGKDRKLTVVFKLDVLSLLNQMEGDQIEMAGTCSRR
jgi:site-specific DNA recombinase